MAAASALGACAPQPYKPPQPVVAGPKGTDLARLIDNARGPVVAGQRLNVAALREFYQRHDFNPVWSRRQRQADALVELVLRAEEHGLSPDRFHGGLLQRRDQIPALQRELLLTDAFLAYGDALAHGAVPTARRKRLEALSPGRIDLGAALDAAISSFDPAAEFEALAPATPTYRALRAALREGVPLPPRLRGAARVAARRAAEARQRTIAVNLERQRWIPRQLPADRVWVNVPDQDLVLFRGNQPAFGTQVIVGDNAERNQSPEFDTVIEASFFNPPWVIPRDIVEAEILPRLAREPDYLARNNMVLRPGGEIEQSAGPEAGLGFVLFDMPNRFDVYLHDTPDRFLFSRSNRRMSRGCIRVQQPRELAALLLDQSIEAIERKIEAGRTTRTTLPNPMPVYVTYQTAFADAEGTLQFRDDFYGRDEDLYHRLSTREQAEA